MKPMHGWPAGFWRMGRAFKAHLLIVHDMPVVPATLPLRLLSNGERLWQAMDELHELPRSSRLRQCLMPLVLAWLPKIQQPSR